MTQWILTFLPVYTVVGTAAGALMSSGPTRAVVLVAGPLIGTLLSWAALPVTGENGNILAVALVLLLTVGLILYYPILLIVWLARRSRL